jgi:DNA-directed RNA polymerase specialized sigma24 family protein
MENLPKLGLLDTDGKPVDERLHKALNDLLPRFRRRFPALRDEVEITEAFEEAARRIEKRERQSGPIEKLRGYAWKALESIGVSAYRRSTMQVRLKRVESRTGPEIVTRLPALDGSVEQIEREILLREIEASLTSEEARIFRLKALGFSSEEIAQHRGSSVNSVDKVMSRLKQKFRTLAAEKE